MHTKKFGLMALLAASACSSSNLNPSMEDSSKMAHDSAFEDFPTAPSEIRCDASKVYEDDSDEENSSDENAYATSYTRFEKPVSVRDYNGTYSGTSGTGYYGYTMFYRDNYTSNWNGYEGVGSHPGVDIDAPYGTDVYASVGGTWYAYNTGCSDYNTSCGNGWGNYIIIKSRVKTPDTGGNRRYIYTIYAHLSQVHGACGSVSRGDLIGQVGRSGNASGPHLHFQIDRNRSSQSHPWWPSWDVNESDSSRQPYGVEYYTRHPMYFINNGYAW